jgi:hypothetical protein
LPLEVQVATVDFDLICANLVIGRLTDLLAGRIAPPTLTALLAAVTFIMKFNYEIMMIGKTTIAIESMQSEIKSDVTDCGSLPATQKKVPPDKQKKIS